MEERSESARIGRRTVLAGLAGVAGTAAFTSTTIGQDASATPGVAWRHDYSGDEREYDVGLTAVVQTDDGGYALAGSGAPITETGVGTEQFALVKAAADGSREWVAFANDETPETDELSFFDLTQTSDGGFVLVGCATNPETGANDRVGGKVAEAAKVTADGTVSWLQRFDAFDENEDSDFDQGHSDNAILQTVTPTADGGVVTGGTFEGSPWLIALDAAGETRWERHYETGFRFDTVEATGEGYRAVVGGRETNVALTLDGDGRVQNRTALDDDGIDYAQTPYNHRFALTGDGSCAYTGRDQNRENMVLGRLDADGSRQWREEYAGAYGGNDLASGVVATADSGFVLYGYMRAGYDGDHTPAIVRTDADGTEQWRRLFDEADASDAAALVETADGGYACLLASQSNTLVKLEPDAELDGSNGDGSGDGTPSDDDPTTDPGSGSSPPDDSDGSGGDSPDDDESTDDDDRGQCPL